jgi:hypothetical protein
VGGRPSAVVGAAFLSTPDRGLPIDSWHKGDGIRLWSSPRQHSRVLRRIADGPATIWGAARAKRPRRLLLRRPPGLGLRHRDNTRVLDGDPLETSIGDTTPTAAACPRAPRALPRTCAGPGTSAAATNPVVWLRLIRSSVRASRASPELGGRRRRAVRISSTRRAVHVGTAVPACPTQRAVSPGRTPRTRGWAGSSSARRSSDDRRAGGLPRSATVADTSECDDGPVVKRGRPDRHQLDLADVGTGRVLEHVQSNRRLADRPGGSTRDSSSESGRVCRGRLGQL